MYQIRCAVSDNKLKDALTALEGITLEPPVIKVIDDMPRNETYKTAPAYTNGHAQAVKRKSNKGPRKGYKQKVSRTQLEGGVKKIILDLIQQSGAARLTSKEIIAAVRAKGYQPGAHSHGLKLLMDNGTLSRVGTGLYAVVGR